MPQCAFHPGVETNVMCPDCERYICPKDMVSTPVGYKCRQCGLAGRPKLGGVKPKQLALGALYGLGAALVAAAVLTAIPFFAFLKAIAYGVAVGEATRRGAGGHRTWEFTAIAAGAAAIGAAVVAVFMYPDVFLLAGGALVAGLYVQSGRFFR